MTECEKTHIIISNGDQRTDRIGRLRPFASPFGDIPSVDNMVPNAHFPLAVSLSAFFQRGLRMAMVQAATLSNGLAERTSHENVVDDWNRILQRILLLILLLLSSLAFLELSTSNRNRMDRTNFDNRVVG